LRLDAALQENASDTDQHRSPSITRGPAIPPRATTERRRSTADAVASRLSRPDFTALLFPTASRAVATDPSAAARIL